MEDLDSDVKEKLSDEEGEIKAYLSHGDALSEETIEKYVSQFWNSEPYKLVGAIMYCQCCNGNRLTVLQYRLIPLRSTGFIMEGFPSTADELRLLTSKGYFPDTTVIIQVGRWCRHIYLKH